MLHPEPVQRDDEGFWTHSAVGLVEEDTAWNDLPGADGMRFTYQSFYDDAPKELIEIYERGSSLDPNADWRDATKQWNPTPPDSPEWFLVGIYDTEEGPYACFAKPSQTQ